MATYHCLIYHLVFNTKFRDPTLPRETWEPTWAYLGGIWCAMGVEPRRIGGVADHVHVVVRARPSVGLPILLRRLKGGSSRWVKERFEGL